MEKLLLSFKEAADVLGLARQTMYKLMNSGQLKSIKIERRRMFRPADLEAFVDEQVKGTHAPKEYEGSGARLKAVK